MGEELYASSADPSLVVAGVGRFSGPEELPPSVVLERLLAETTAQVLQERRRPVVERLREREAEFLASLKGVEREAAEIAARGPEAVLEALRASAARSAEAAKLREEAEAVVSESEARLLAARGEVEDAKMAAQAADREASAARRAADDEALRLEEAREAEQLEILRKQWAVDRASEDPKLMVRFMELMSGLKPAASSTVAPPDLAPQGGPAPRGLPPQPPGAP